MNAKSDRPNVGQSLVCARMTLSVAVQSFVNLRRDLADTWYYAKSGVVLRSYSGVGRSGEMNRCRPETSCVLTPSRQMKTPSSLV